MPDWTKSMQQTYEYYSVDPITWRDDAILDTIEKCDITRDLSLDTLGSANIDLLNTIGEKYVRCYLITVQNGVREKTPLGTFLVQSPTETFNGKRSKLSAEAYTPLIELKEGSPALGFYISKNSNVMSNVSFFTKNNLRAPVISSSNHKKIEYDYVADVEENWLTYLSSLLSTIDYSYFIDPMGNVLYTPRQSAEKMNYIWTYDESNSSILHPEITIDHDIYGIPNVLQLVYSTENETKEITVKNDDSNSPLSIQNRGREIFRRITDPDVQGYPSDDYYRRYAEDLLKNLSTVEYTVSYKHGYCPVTIGDCVLLDCPSAGLNKVKAKVISQKISCRPGCQVSEKAIYTNKLWR